MSHPTRHIFRNFAVLLITAICATAQITLQVFVHPHPVVEGGTIGFAYAGNKFVGSVDHDGVGALYATDLDGTNVRVFAPTGSLPAGSMSREHYVASSVGLGGFLAVTFMWVQVMLGCTCRAQKCPPCQTEFPAPGHQDLRQAHQIPSRRWLCSCRPLAGSLPCK